MLGSMAQEIPNPTAQDPSDEFFRECSASSPSDSCPTVMGDGVCGSVYKSWFAGSCNLCSKNTDFSPSLNQVNMEINDLEIFYLSGVNEENISAGKETGFSRLLFSRHKKEITILVASSAISIIMALHIFVLLCQLLLSRKHLGAFVLQEEEPEKSLGFGSIPIPMLELFSYMVLVSAVASMILLRAKFTHMHSVMFVSWTILMIFESDNAINALYLIIIGNFFIWWYAVCYCKSSSQIQGQKLSGTVEPEISHDLHP